MKIFHLSDLHIGKLINGYDMEDDQRYVFDQIIEYVEKEKPDAVIIAGDIYDKTVPSAKAVKLFDEFLTRLAGVNTAVLIISGNHDSAERLDFGSRILEKNNVYLKGTYEGNATKVELYDEYGVVNFYLMPFVKPSIIRAYSDEDFSSYSDAMAFAISKMDIDSSERNILVAHQNVTHCGVNKTSDSELICIGNVDNIESGVFEKFDYVALGHLHSPQNIGSEKIRYCGTPVIYSMSEKADDKSITVINIREKNNMTIKLLPLCQLHSWYDFKGTMDEALSREYNEDYARIILTDKEVIIDALYKLRKVYGRLIEMSFDTGSNTTYDECDHTIEEVENLTPRQAFANFYMNQLNEQISEEDLEYIDEIINEWEMRK